MIAVASAARPHSPGRPASFDELLQRATTDLIGNPREALAAAAEAVQHADALSDPDSQALARHARGEAYRFLGQHEAALSDYSAAEALYRRTGRPVEAARMDACAVDSLRCLGRLPEALRTAARARRVFRRHGERFRMAVLDEIIGLVHFQQDDYVHALRLLERARPAIAAVGRPVDLAVLNNNAATALTNLDRLREAETLYAAARAYYAEQHTDAALARVDINLGYLAFRQGRYGAAVDLLRGAADVFEGLRNMPLAIRTRLDLSETYLALNLLDEAGGLSQEQFSLAEELGLESERARALFYLSTQRGRIGRFDEALDGLREAERAFAAHGNLLWRTRCADGCAALLLARNAPGDVSEAVRLARRAMRVYSKHGLPSRHSSACAMLARAHLQRGRLSLAEEEARFALWLAEGIGVPWLLFECHYTLGRALRARGENERAYVEYREATEALERVRAELQPEELRQSLVSDKTDVHQELVHLCLERGAPDEALRQAERAKSRAFAERLAGSVDVQLDPQVVGTTDANLLERMRQVRDELIWLYSRLGDGNTIGTGLRPGRPAANAAHSLSQTQRVRRDVAAREAELLRLHRRLQPASRPRAVALGISRPISDTDAMLDRLRRRLQPGTKVLEYFAAGDELVAFVFDSRRLVAHRLGSIQRIAELVDRFRFQVSKFGLGSTYIQEHEGNLLLATQHALSELYSALIDPAADELIDAARLIVIPHGVLHYLPFHALMDPSGTPLIERLEVTYAPSAGVLASCLERPGIGQHDGQPLLVGVPEPAIPRVSGEIEALQRVFGSSCVVLTGESATQSAFRQHAPRATVIHLASHALFRQDNPMFSAIRLADGWLSLYDLYGLRLRAALVTLSACETGVNEVLAGDELVGLTRGFFEAGTAAVVVSLWSVNDDSTAHLMERFYSHLDRGVGTSAAMRAAQTELRQTYAHPYYWAPFLVVGRP